jgi:hypothetical protein
MLRQTPKAAQEGLRFPGGSSLNLSFLDTSALKLKISRWDSSCAIFACLGDLSTFLE